MLVILTAAAALASGPDASRLDKVIDAAAGSGFAGEVLVADRRDVLYARAVSAPGRPHQRGDLWRWASVTKQLTATLVLHDVERGRLALDDTLSKHLPAFSGPTTRKITIRQLLQHTAGLPNPDDTPSMSETGFAEFYRRTGAEVGTTGDALGYCARTPKAQPGAGFSYNNCDYLVLGAILERVHKKAFHSILRDVISSPLRLKSLDIAQSGTSGPLLTRGVEKDGSPEPSFELATFGPAGAAYGSSDDLVRFDQALLRHDLLSAATSKVAWSGDAKLGYVALGAWSFSAPLAGCSGPVRLVERRGEIGGVEVRNLLAPELERALVVFADRAGLDFGEVWQGKGLTYTLATHAFCPSKPPG